MIPAPTVESAVQRSRMSVLDLLGPLRPSYTSRRVGVDGSPCQPDGSAPSVVAPEPGLVPCIVEGVITVDPEGRIPWRFRFDGLDISSVELALGPDGRSIEVSTEPTNDGPCRHRDRHGRLHLPHGLLRAIDCRPGDRVAVIRLRDQPRLLLVPQDRLSIRPGSDRTRSLSGRCERSPPSSRRHERTSNESRYRSRALLSLGLARSRRR